MPIYEYECENCKKIFEAIVSINNQESIRCTSCGSGDTKKLMSASAVTRSSGDDTAPCQSRGGFT